MAPSRSTTPYRGSHRNPARRAPVLARAVTSLAVLAVLVVVATLFLDALLIVVGLLTPVASSVPLLRQWLRRLTTPPARATPVTSR